MNRRIPFAGALNFRDIGGYPTSNGRHTRWRAVYRSDSLHYLTPQDLPSFDALGIEAIYDLRRASELRLHPGPRPCVHLELPSADPLDQGKVSGLKTRLEGEQWLLSECLGMLTGAAAPFGVLFSRLADAQRLPAVIHCLGGKDRTGLAIALLLTALGVRREDVLDDYQLTNDCLAAARIPEVVQSFVESGIARDAAEGILSAPRWAMAQALKSLDEIYDGIDGYLLGHCGMEPATLTALRTALII